jgi:hypothetical protein
VIGPSGYLNGGYRRKGLSLDGRNEATIDDVRQVVAGEREPGSRYASAERAAEALAEFDAAVAEQDRRRNRCRAPLSGSTRLSLTSGARTITAPAAFKHRTLVVIAVAHH